MNITSAIHDRHLLSFVYHDFQQIVELHSFGINTNFSTSSAIQDMPTVWMTKKSL